VSQATIDGAMYLGIEIGGTKLQLGVGTGDGSVPAALERFDVRPDEGAPGILRHVEACGQYLADRYRVQGVGCGFGGPVEPGAGVVVKSHHVEGWTDFPLVSWLRERFGVPATLANDADTAALAEARFGAGQRANPVLYVTVGTGIGGGLVVDGRIYRGQGVGAMELGHLRPGLHADRPDQNLESIAAGWGIAAAAQARLTGGAVVHRLGPLASRPRPNHPEEVRQRLIEEEEVAEEHAADLLERCGGAVDRLSAKIVAQAAEEGNGIAQELMSDAASALGWALAQAVTLLAPEIIVVGGGVSLAGEPWFFGPLRRETARYVFPPLAESFRIVPARLGEEVVVHGALALARDKAIAQRQMHLAP
jgi:glucokinase